MLTRRRSVFTLFVAIALALGVGSANGAAVGPDCPPHSEYCVITVETPGNPGQPGSSSGPTSGPGGVRVCYSTLLGTAVPCHSDSLGWWSQIDECYYRLVDPQPAGSEPAWENHFPDGAIYGSMCPGVRGTGGGWVWFPTPPDGFGAVTTTPAELAQRAVGTMQLAGPAIGIAPKPGSTGLVGIPVWLWTDVSPTTWGPTSASASIPGLTVTATAQAKRIVWDMGDGTKVTCTTPGTVYSKSLGGGPSPTCGHIYRESSAGKPGDAFALTATTTWEVTWTGGGTSGTLTVTRASSTTIRIGELQVLVT
ncbi:hypothetical protein [Pengzhenrongella sicca]|uniref:ATP/GTP-binding protein n=1 Tax=Pengzhenrongella sicca TaxID=2819238 RepID=A0A8A4ZKC4_9MICO|nr:hypothetical protein [Pengzhenrongella sicca]QTE30038.1 hypothetical protein J4E96_03165 [Pengzhenrongella sicca]